MPLHSTHPFREKVLFYGEMGTGKTKAAVNIAIVLERTGSTDRVFVIDTEDSWLDATASLGTLANVHSVYGCRSLEAVDDAVQEILKEAQPGDWVVFDKAGELWSFVQDYYVREVNSRGMAQTLLSQAKAGKRKWALLQGEIEWQVVNTIYRDVMNPLLFESPAHLYFTASAGTMNPQDPNRQNILLYGRQIAKPVAQKDLGYQMRTVLMGSQPVASRWCVTSVKDRERPLLAEADMSKGFVATYLLGPDGPAGWEI